MPSGMKRKPPHSKTGKAGTPLFPGDFPGKSSNRRRFPVIEDYRPVRYNENVPGFLRTAAAGVSGWRKAYHQRSSLDKITCGSLNTLREKTDKWPLIPTSISSL